MAKEFSRQFYQSTQWKKCRAAFIADVGGLCTRCAAHGIIVPGYIVHHKVYLTPENINDPNITLSFDNLEYLCHDCHDDEHMFGEEIQPPRWEWVDGRLNIV